MTWGTLPWLPARHLLSQTDPLFAACQAASSPSSSSCQELRNWRKAWAWRSIHCLGWDTGAITGSLTIGYSWPIAMLTILCSSQTCILVMDRVLKLENTPCLTTIAVIELGNCYANVTGFLYQDFDFALYLFRPFPTLHYWNNLHRGRGLILEFDPPWLQQHNGP